MGTKGTSSKHNLKGATVRLNLSLERELVQTTRLEVPSVRVLKVGKAEAWKEKL